MPPPPPISLTVGGAEYIPRIAKLLSKAFVNEPVGRYINLSAHNLPNSSSITTEQREAAFIERLTDRIVVNPHLIEAGDWAAGAVWFPPNSKLPAPNRMTSIDVINEYYDKFSEVKAKHLKGRKHWYLNLMGRDPSRTEPGVVRALIETYLQKAKEEGVPAWVEATSEHSRDVYAHLGFKMAAIVRLAVGKADKDGYRKEGGEGIPVYGMIAEPEPRGR